MHVLPTRSKTHDGETVVPALTSLIAVVDDDENVGRSLGRVLSANGHRVRSFTRARDYLDECRTMEHSCVLVDIRMPEMDGIEMQRTAADLGVTVPAVFMT